MNAKKRHFGLSLSELMVVLAILAIISAIAVPWYSGHTVTARRAAAKAEMMTIANLQEQFLAANRRYATQANLTASGYQLPAEVSDYYSYAVAVTTTSYTLTFTPLSTGPQSADGSLTLNNFGAKTPEDKW